jgi:hypothetical protein
MGGAYHLIFPKVPPYIGLIKRLFRRADDWGRVDDMTLRYSHPSPGHLRNAVDAIDQALNVPADPTSPFIYSLLKTVFPPIPQQV